MAAKKEISGFIKLQIKGGQANPAPPVGPALGQRGVNIMEFCKAFNDKTKSMAGKPRTSSRTRLRSTWSKHNGVL